MNENSFAANNSSSMGAAGAAGGRFFKQIDEKHINQEISQMLWVNSWRLLRERHRVQR